MNQGREHQRRVQAPVNLLTVARLREDLRLRMLSELALRVARDLNNGRRPADE